MPDRCRSVENLLSAWLDGELAAADEAAVGRHLQGCGRCRSSVDSLRVTRSLLRSAPVRRAARDIAGVRPPARRLAGARLAVAGVALLSVVAGAAYSLGAGPPPDGPVVRVPMELYLADHLFHSADALVVTPVIVEEAP